ncbi:ribosome assembly RNA-binding protein YhbY [Methylococcus geothermalis]|uniref:Ribosome assembly RNA-binding protein YhbY n=1 Tax=Methylococcus geothermalis TaxID=2681310 RepID=A0A858Q766_9GAMM|nr:ribosome assembly RNA-binding protein YhbY [Methylococcus geothermalis]QJD29689.1 ribosome assembly RNA-binding protein YhbY [Methylococcus geothermalis]
MTSELRRQLRAKAHKLKPVVITGQAGITPGVLAEIGLALDHHELIKVRVNAGDRETRAEMATSVCRETGAELIQSLGHVITLFRKSPERGKKA